MSGRRSGIDQKQYQACQMEALWRSVAVGGWEHCNLPVTCLVSAQVHNADFDGTHSFLNNTEKQKAFVLAFRFNDYRGSDRSPRSTYIKSRH